MRKENNFLYYVNISLNLNFWQLNQGCNLDLTIMQKTFTIPVLHINHTFSVRIAKVGSVGRSVMNHCFIYRICCLVWKNACRETRNTFLHLCSTTKQHQHVPTLVQKKPLQWLLGNPAPNSDIQNFAKRQLALGSLLGNCQVT